MDVKDRNDLIHALNFFYNGCWLAVLEQNKTADTIVGKIFK